MTPIFNRIAIFSLAFLMSLGCSRNSSTIIKFHIAEQVDLNKISIIYLDCNYHIDNWSQPFFFEVHTEGAFVVEATYARGNKVRSKDIYVSPNLDLVIEISIHNDEKIIVKNVSSGANYNNY